FYSTYVSKNLFASRIYSLNINSNQIVELSTDSFSQAAQFTPDEKRVVYMSGSQADIFLGEVQGADWWVVDRDGHNAQRLTCMNPADNATSVNHYRLAGVFSFNSARSFFGDVLTKPLGLVGKIVKVTMTE